jgi:hypothetical protein
MVVLDFKCELPQEDKLDSLRSLRGSSDDDVILG